MSKKPRLSTILKDTTLVGFSKAEQGKACASVDAGKPARVVTAKFDKDKPTMPESSPK